MHFLWRSNRAEHAVVVQMVLFISFYIYFVDGHADTVGSMNVCMNVVISLSSLKNVRSPFGGQDIRGAV